MSAFAEPFLPDLHVAESELTTVRADLVVIPVTEEDAGDRDLAAVSQTLAALLEVARRSAEFRGKAFETLIERAPGWAAPRVLLIGCGKAEERSVERVRRVAATAGLAAKRHRAAHVAFALGGAIPASMAKHVADGLTLAAFSEGRYKTGEPVTGRLEAITLVTPKGQDVREAAERGRLIADCCNRARALADEPGNRLPPRVFAERAVAALDGSGIVTEVLDEKALEKLGMGLLLGVGQGSVEPPRLLVMRYEPKGASAAPVLGLVGKGVTFDTGGISIKPADGMERMKDDMAGGASVVSSLARSIVWAGFSCSRRSGSLRRS
jgi:leucyl aminopeptidase